MGAPPRGAKPPDPAYTQQIKSHTAEPSCSGRARARIHATLGKCIDCLRHHPLDPHAHPVCQAVLGSPTD